MVRPTICFYRLLRFGGRQEPGPDPPSPGLGNWRPALGGFQKKTKMVWLLFCISETWSGMVSASGSMFQQFNCVK